MAERINREIHLKNRPNGMPEATDFETTLKNSSTTPLTTAWLWPEAAAIAATRSVLLSVSAMGVLLGQIGYWTITMRLAEPFALSPVIAAASN